MQVFRGLVGPIDIEIELTGRTERGHLDTGRLEPAGRALGARDDGRELGGKRRQRVDQEINGATGADAERDTVLDVRQRCGCDEAFLVFLAHGDARENRPPRKESARNLAGTTLV